MGQNMSAGGAGVAPLYQGSEGAGAALAVGVNQWLSLELPGSPSPRSGHASAISEDGTCMWMYGGFWEDHEGEHKVCFQEVRGGGGEREERIVQTKSRHPYVCFLSRLTRPAVSFPHPQPHLDAHSHYWALAGHALLAIRSGCGPHLLCFRRHWRCVHVSKSGPSDSLCALPVCAFHPLSLTLTPSSIFKHVFSILFSYVPRPSSASSCASIFVPSLCSWLRPANHPNPLSLSFRLCSPPSSHPHHTPFSSCPACKFFFLLFFHYFGEWIFALLWLLFSSVAQGDAQFLLARRMATVCTCATSARTCGASR
jgi:hypothetical protein